MASQLDTFTKWWNSYLEPRGFPITDLVSSLKDGYLAFRLLEALEQVPAAPQTFIFCRVEHNSTNRPSIFIYTYKSCISFWSIQEFHDQYFDTYFLLLPSLLVPSARL